jgi:hypothetical protein
MNIVKFSHLSIGLLAAIVASAAPAIAQIQAPQSTAPATVAQQTMPEPMPESFPTPTERREDSSQEPMSESAPPAANTCRLVLNPSQGLVIRSQPSSSSARVGGVGVRERVFLTTLPATTKMDGATRTWVAIAQPAKGWISNGTRGSRGNLIMCP